jgi:hypothetical protein
MVSNDAPHVLLASGMLVVHHEDSVRNEKRDKRTHAPAHCVGTASAHRVQWSFLFVVHTSMLSYDMLKKLLLYFM